MRNFHWQIRNFKTAPDGRPMVAFGFRFGYWPCLNAPFVQLALGSWRCEAWYGLPAKEEA